jgi:hypothetical protein
MCSVDFRKSLNLHFCLFFVCKLGVGGGGEGGRGVGVYQASAIQYVDCMVNWSLYSVNITLYKSPVKKRRPLFFSGPFSLPQTISPLGNKELT